jgi:hypothetical protein
MHLLLFSNVLKWDLLNLPTKSLTLKKNFQKYLLYKCPEEHRFQAAGNERKKERKKIERKKEKSRQTAG